MGWFNKTIYTRKNGYGDADTNAVQFQVGRRLHEAQVLHAKISNDEYVPTKEELLELIHWYCELVNWTGQLRADYNVMRECAKGKAEFREQ